MIEKLFPLDPAPGYHNNGTTYQSKNRWLKGSLVRFFQGNKQPVGGWVQRTLTGAAISGTPNAALSWTLNDGTSYMAVGTSTKLFVVSTANVVTDISPTDISGDGLTHYWQLEVFGGYLIATYNRGDLVIPPGRNVFVWRGVLATPAIGAYNQYDGPSGAFGIVTTPERFMVVLRGTSAETFSLSTGTIVN